MGAGRQRKSQQAQAPGTDRFRQPIVSTISTGRIQKTSICTVDRICQIERIVSATSFTERLFYYLQCCTSDLQWKAYWCMIGTYIMNVTLNNPETEHGRMKI